jgi:diguanylate cyclase
MRGQLSTFVRRSYYLLAALVAAYAVSTVVRPSGWHLPLLDNGLTSAVQLSAAALCLLRAARVPQLRGAWAAFGAGLLLWSLGDAYWAFRFGTGGAPGPSLADVGYLLFYPLAYAGLVAVMRSRTTRFPPSLWWDGAIVGLGAAATAAAFAFGAIEHAKSSSKFWRNQKRAATSRSTAEAA